MICAWKNCNRYAKAGDEFCSSICAKLHYGTVEEKDVDELRREKKNRKQRIRELRKKHGDTVTFVNPEALEHRLPGSFESGKRR